MANKLKIIEDRQFCQSGVMRRESRIIALCDEKREAICILADAFEKRWEEHSCPDVLWVSECCPPEEFPEDAWFSSKFPDEGEFRFRIEARVDIRREMSGC